MSHTHAVVKKLTLTFMSKQTPLKNYTSIQKLHWKAAAESALAADSPRFAAQQNGKRKHTKIVFILRINLEICSLEMGKRDGSMMLQEMKTKKKQLLVIPTSPCC